MSDEQTEPKASGRWLLGGVIVVAVLALGLAILGKGFNINLMDRLTIAVAADDKYIEVAKLLRGDEDTNLADAEGLLSTRGFYRIGLEGEPIESEQVTSLLETKGFYRLGRPGEPVESDDVERVLASKGYRHIGGSDEPIRDEVARALTAKGYYYIGSQELIDAIRRFDVDEFGPDRELAEVFQTRLRSALLDMMGSLDGPFEVDAPGVLWEASTEFLGALDDLEEALRQSERASRFLTEFWLAMANRRGVFGLNSFNAEVQVVSAFAGDDRPRILVCNDNDYLDGRDVQLYALGAGEDPPVIGFTNPYEAERHVSACFRTGPELASALAGQAIPLAVNRAAAQEIFGDTGNGAELPDHFEAQISVLPGS